MTLTRSLERSTLPALDGLRGLAACWVVIHHLRTNQLVGGGSLLQNGFMLVDAFFVLSGFVMAYQYGHRMRDFGDVGRFIWRRLARIWPLHAVILSVMMLPRLVALAVRGTQGSQLLVAGDHSLVSWVASIFLLHGMGIFKYAVWNGPSWTISVEFFTYIIFALLVLGKNPVRYGPGLILIFSSGAFLWAEKVYLAVPLHLSFFRCLFGFFIGSASAEIFLIFRLRLASTRGLSAMELGALVLMLGVVAVGGNHPLSLAFPFICAVAVILLATGKGVASQVLSSAPFQALGAWSLGIYLMHIPILNVAFAMGGKLGFTGLNFSPIYWGLRETFAYLAVVGIMAAVAHHAIEQPARAWLSKWLR